MNLQSMFKSQLNPSRCGREAVTVHCGNQSESMKYVGNILEGMWTLAYVQQEKQLYNMDEPLYGARFGLTDYIINYNRVVK